MKTIIYIISFLFIGSLQTFAQDQFPYIKIEPVAHEECPIPANIVDNSAIICQLSVSYSMAIGIKTYLTSDQLKECFKKNERNEKCVTETPFVWSAKGLCYMAEHHRLKCERDSLIEDYVHSSEKGNLLVEVNKIVTISTNESKILLQTYKEFHYKLVDIANNKTYDTKGKKTKILAETNILISAFDEVFDKNDFTVEQ